MSSPSGFSPLERIASSDELKIDQQQQPGQFDIWCSIPIQKTSSLPPPYVHPLVRKSKSCLSLKSLEICTENLGSESGSDGCPPSDISLSDTQEVREEIEQAVEELVEDTKRPESPDQAVKVDVRELVVMNYSKKSSPPSRCFPPPLKSLSKPGGGGIQMKTHRKDGRLVLEAATVPTCQNYFNSQRQDGRLVLTFATPIQESKSLEEVFETDEEKEFEFSPDNEIEGLIIEKQEEDGKGIVLEMTPILQPTGVMNVHRSAMMVNKFTGLTNNRNNTTTWTSLTSKHINVGEALPTIAAAEEAPPRMSTPAASCFNRYEYCWRKETSSFGGIYDSLNQQSLTNTKNTYYNNLFLTSKNNYYKEDKQKSNGEKIAERLIVVPAYCCKPEPRTSLVKFWEPFCIATS